MQLVLLFTLFGACLARIQFLAKDEFFAATVDSKLEFKIVPPLYWNGTNVKTYDFTFVLKKESSLDNLMVEDDIEKTIFNDTVFDDMFRTTIINFSPTILDNNVDCSSTTLSNSFLKSSPIPIVKPNELVYFHCSVLFNGLKKPEILVETSLNITRYFEPTIEFGNFNGFDSRLTKNFEYMVPSDNEMASKDHGKTIKCHVGHNNYFDGLSWTQARNGKYNYTHGSYKASIMSCQFRLNVQFEPYVEQFNISKNLTESIL